MKYVAHKLILLNFLIIFTLGVCYADSNTNENASQTLIDTYGKEVIIKVIIDKRYGQTTIEQNEQFIDSFGRPNKDKINAKSISLDLEKMDLNIEQFTVAIEKHLEKQGKKSNRLSTQSKTVSKSKTSKSKPEVLDAEGKPGVNHAIQFNSFDADGENECVSSCRKSNNNCLSEARAPCFNTKIAFCTSKMQMKQKEAEGICESSYASCSEPCI